MKFRGITALVIAVLLAACGDGLETRTFPLEHVTAASILPLIAPYVNTEGSVIVAGTALFESIAVRERPDVLKKIEGIIAEHDQPQATVTLRFQLIEADGFTTTDPAIADVEEALRKLFRFDGYHLLADAVMANVTPMLIVPTERKSWADYQSKQTMRVGDQRYMIFTDVRSATRGENGGGSADLAVLLYVEGQAIGGEQLLETSVRVPDGQTVVIGNAQGATSEHTLILTVRPEIQ